MGSAAQAEAPAIATDATASSSPTERKLTIAATAPDSSQVAYVALPARSWARRAAVTSSSVGMATVVEFASAVVDIWVISAPCDELAAKVVGESGKLELGDSEEISPAAVPSLKVTVGDGDDVAVSVEVPLAIPVVVAVAVVVAVHVVVAVPVVVLVAVLVTDLLVLLLVLEKELMGDELEELLELEELKELRVVVELELVLLLVHVEERVKELVEEVPLLLLDVLVELRLVDVTERDVLELLDVLEVDVVVTLGLEVLDVVVTLNVVEVEVLSELEDVVDVADVVVVCSTAGHFFTQCSVVSET